MLTWPPQDIFSSPNAFLLESRPTSKDPATPSKLSLVNAASIDLSTPVHVSLWHLIIFNVALNSTLFGGILPPFCFDIASSS